MRVEMTKWVYGQIFSEKNKKNLKVKILEFTIKLFHIKVITQDDFSKWTREEKMQGFKMIF